METLRLILSGGTTGSQSNILRELQQRGFDVTQATLSRDLRQLRAVKIPMEKGYGYILPEHPQYQRTTKPATTATYLNAAGFRSIAFSGNLAVIHTRPGYAGGLASDIDSRGSEAIAGTVAGDDTIIVVGTEGTERQQLVDALCEAIPSIKREDL